MRHPESLALADPPNRQGFTTGVPRTLSFAQTDRAISAFAARLRGLGLQTDSAVAIQLPNTVESTIAFLGVLRAGMIPVPLPLLWRQEEIVAALRQVGARTIVSCSRIGQVAQIEIAMQSAVELFSIRHVCCFGPDPPDGIVPLDDIYFFPKRRAVSVSRIGPAAAHVAAITFYPDANGFAPIARSHVELVARGMEIFLETGATSDTPILSTIPIGSFAGIGLTVVPWLLSGGALHLHHSFDPESFGAQCRAVADGTVILPTAAVAAIAESGSLKDLTQTVVALWRTPERFAAAKSWEGRSSLVDVTSFGETGSPLVVAETACQCQSRSVPSLRPIVLLGRLLSLKQVSCLLERWRCAAAWSPRMPCSHMLADRFPITPVMSIPALPATGGETPRH